MKILSSLAVTALSCVALVGVHTPAGADDASTVAWSKCGKGLQCGTVTVPVDYQRPNGAHLRIAMIRLPARDQARRIGSLFVNPGGPGISGVATVRARASTLFTAEVRERFDIIGFDARGTGASHPIRCYASNEAENADFQDALGIPLTRAESRRAILAALRFDAACAARNGSFLRHVSTANTARDLDRLRLAVGDRAGLTYDGRSYGSFIGETYANMFPGHVRAMVLDGIVDPDAWVRSLPDEMAVGVWGRGGYGEANADAMDQFLDLCAAAGRGCRFSTGPEPLPLKWAHLLAVLKQHPVTVDYSGSAYTWTYSDVVQTTSAYLRFPAYYRALGRLLQPIWHAANDPAAARATAQSSPRATALAAGSYNNILDALFAITCVDSNNPRDPWLIAHSAAHSQDVVPDFGPSWAYFSLPCAGWPTRDTDRYTGPFTRRTAHPVLVVGNTHDSVTSYRNAKVVAEMMPGARLLTLDGVGHTSWDVTSRCVQDASAAYWISGTLPPDGTVCQPDRQPFADRTVVDARPQPYDDGATFHFAARPQRS